MIGTKENWADKNSLRNYPLNIVSGEFPEGILCDVSVLIRGSNVVPYVSSLKIGKGLVSIVFSDVTTGHDIFAAVCPRDGNETVLVSPSNFFDVSGSVKFGNLISQKEGLFLYASGLVMLLNHCFCSIGENVILSQSVGGSITKNKGDVILSFSGGFNSRIYTETLPIEGDVSIVEISLDNPSRFKELCSPTTTVCECLDAPIKQINSVLPDSSTHNITIENLDGIVLIEELLRGITVSAIASSNLVCDQNNLPKPGGKLKGEQ